MTQKLYFCANCRDRRSVRDIKPRKIGESFLTVGICMECEQPVDIWSEHSLFDLARVWTRRNAVKILVFGGGGYVLAKMGDVGTGVVTDAIIRSRQPKSDDQLEAERLCKSIFGLDANMRYCALGRKYGNAFSADNVAALRGLRIPLEFDGDLEDCEPLSALPKDDCVIFGGPNCTLASQLAFEFKKDVPNAPVDELWRPEDRGETPIIPLKFYGLSDRRLVKNDQRVGRILEGGKRVEGANWGIVCVLDGATRDNYPVLQSKSSTEDPITLPSGETIGRIVDDYLVITRIPNFLSPEFDPNNRKTWTHMVVFDGGHGTGTRAAELLPASRKLKLLNTIAEKVKGADVFQVVLHVGEVAEDGGYHKAHDIDLVHRDDIKSIVTIDVDSNKWIELKNHALQDNSNLAIATEFCKLRRK